MNELTLRLQRERKMRALLRHLRLGGFTAAKWGFDVDEACELMESGKLNAPVICWAWLDLPPSGTSPLAMIGGSSEDRARLIDFLDRLGHDTSEREEDTTCLQIYIGVDEAPISTAYSFTLPPMHA